MVEACGLECGCRFACGPAALLATGLLGNMHPQETIQQQLHDSLEPYALRLPPWPSIPEL